MIQGSQVKYFFTMEAGVGGAWGFKKLFMFGIMVLCTNNEKQKYIYFELFA